MGLGLKEMGTAQHAGLDDTRSVIRFGDAVWDERSLKLQVRGEAVKLPWRATACLDCLVSARGAVVPKDELRKQVWGDSLMEESNLARCITLLRKALDPAPGGGSYIENVARIGYRLAVPVAEGPAPEAQALPPPRRFRLPVAAAAVFVILVLAIAGALMATQRRSARLRQADELIQQALVLVRKNDPTDAAKSNELLQQAMELAPDYPLGQAAMAEWAARRGNGSFEAAIELARRAVRSDPGCAQCQAIAGYVLMTRAWKWDESGRHLQRANQLDPADISTRLWYAEWLAVHRRYDEAMAQGEAVIRAHPEQPRGHTMKEMILFLSGRPAEARKAYENAISLNLQFNAAHYWMFRVAQMSGDDVGAIVARARQLTTMYQRHEEEYEKLYGQFIGIYRKGGRRALVESWLSQMGAGPMLEVQRYARAHWWMWIGETEKAIVELEAAVNSKPYHLIFVAADPAFVPLHGHERYRDVVRRVGLTPPVPRVRRGDQL